MKYCLIVLCLLIPFAAWADCQCDLDEDGWADIIDNCSEVANADQRDTDGDNYGNMCDADFDNDGVVSTPDLVVFRAAMFTQVGDADYNVHADFDGDGVVSTPDVVIFRSLLYLPVGPAGEEAGSCQ